MSPAEIVNFIVSVIVFTSIWGVIAVAYFYGDTTGRILTQTDSGRYSLSSTGWTLALWGGWWVTLFILYVFIGTQRFSLVATLSALGDLSTLAAVIAFCRGSSFRLREVMPLTFIVALVVVWCLVISTLRHTPQGMLIAIGPPAVLSTTSAIALGWAVIVRCGWRSSAFGLLTLLYAFVQPAAYVSAFILDLPALSGVKNEHFFTISRVFWFLAVGKIVIAISFLGYFFSSDHDFANLRREQYWPSRDVRVGMHPSFAKALKILGGSVGSIIIGLITASMYPRVAETISKWLK